MFSPTVWLVLVLMGLGLFGSGISIGYKWERNAHQAALADTLNDAVEGASLAADLETARQLAGAKREANARAAASEIKHKGELDALKKSRAACSRDSESVSLLNAAIDQANGKGNADTSVPDAVRPAGETAGWLGTVGEKLGVPNSGNVRQVPPPSQ